MTTETTKKYLDVNAADFSDAFQALIAENRSLYEMQRELNKRIVAQLNSEVTLVPGRTIVGIAWTRWGQLQAVEADKPVAKQAAAKRGNLADYRAQQQAEGRNC